MSSVDWLPRHQICNQSIDQSQIHFGCLHIPEALKKRHPRLGSEITLNKTDVIHQRAYLNDLSLLAVF
jgi:hypothetical protein